MNTFIERSNALLTARPDTTRISTRYTHKNVSSKSHTGDALPAVAVVKTYDPVSGTLFKFRVRRINELNRILRSLGPYPVDSQENGQPVIKPGIASLMAQQPFEEKVQEPKQEEKRGVSTGGKKKKSKR